MEQDANVEKNKGVMESIWASVPKERNLPPGLTGEYIRYASTDPKYLYLSGFVDDKTFTYEEWEAAFEPSKQADNSYLISKAQFLLLGKYKYNGPIKKPLDAMKIREGWYELQAWHEFAVRSVIPSTTVTVEELVQAEQIMKQKGLIKNGKILIDKHAKLRIKSLIDNYPSPTRLREMSVDVVHQKKVQAEEERSRSAGQKTSYEKGAKLGAKEKKNLSDTLLKTAQIKPSDSPQPETISLKDLAKASKRKK